ncbi:MAG: hypothetical protein ACFFA6_00480 [Promethearchaeota archaeon]
METKLVEKKARGFAGIIKNVLDPLNEHPNFKEKFKNVNRKYLVNASNLNFAALIIIENGTIIIESVRNVPKSNLKKKILGWNGYISMNSQIFLALVMNKISLLNIGLKWLTRKVKIKGLIKMVTLLKLINLLKE